MTRAAWVAALVVGCGSGAKQPIVINDAPKEKDAFGCGGEPLCNPVTQTGCCVGWKCTWFVDQITPTPLGHIDCAPDGPIPDGGACSFGPPGSTTGFDNCKRGSFCTGATCETLCDPSLGAAACMQSSACKPPPNAFTVNGTTTYGTCAPTCDPLADNTFGKGSKPGTTCSSSEGCYGFPDFGTNPPSYFTCMAEGGSTFVQGSPCTQPCAASDGTPNLAGCAQGFMPFYFESETVMTRVCTSFCTPASCYAGHCGADGMNYAGIAPHRCNSTDSSGTFDMTSGGHHCHYLWDYEWDELTFPQSTTFIRSPFSDTLGVCQDHAAFMYASQPGSGVADTTIPGCDQIPLPGFGDHTVHPPSSGTTCPNNAATCCQTTNGCLGAADFGCVDSATAGLPFLGKDLGPPRASWAIQRGRPAFAPIPIH